MSQPKRLPKLVDAEPEIRIAKATPRARHLLKKFGITPEQYEELYAQQNGCCAICGRHQSSFKRRLAVEHDHGELGQVRGLVCFKCNKFLIGRHTKETIQVVYDYLMKDYTGWLVPSKIKKKRKRRARRKRIR